MRTMSRLMDTRCDLMSRASRSRPMAVAPLSAFSAWRHGRLVHSAVGARPPLSWNQLVPHNSLLNATCPPPFLMTEAHDCRRTRRRRVRSGDWEIRTSYRRRTSLRLPLRLGGARALLIRVRSSEHSRLPQLDWGLTLAFAMIVSALGHSTGTGSRQGDDALPHGHRLT